MPKKLDYAEYTVKALEFSEVHVSLNKFNSRHFTVSFLCVPLRHETFFSARSRLAFKFRKITDPTIHSY